ncbi:MAG: hypothetical protein R3A10_17525 [Caldilineaceae bacterium]
MSHEIRTPMNAVIGMTMPACSWTPTWTGSSRSSPASSATAATRFLVIINDILDFSKTRPTGWCWKTAPSTRASLESALDLWPRPLARRGSTWPIPHARAHARVDLR